MESTLPWITLKSASLSIFLFFQSLTVFFAIPRKILCIGSTVWYRTTSKYGRASKMEYLSPYHFSRDSLAVGVVELLEHVFYVRRFARAPTDHNQILNNQVFRQNVMLEIL